MSGGRPRWWWTVEPPHAPRCMSLSRPQPCPVGAKALCAHMACSPMGAQLRGVSPPIYVKVEFVSLTGADIIICRDKLPTAARARACQRPISARVHRPAPHQRAPDCPHACPTAAKCHAVPKACPCARACTCQRPTSARLTAPMRAQLLPSAMPCPSIAASGGGGGVQSDHRVMITFHVTTLHLAPRVPRPRRHGMLAHGRTAQGAPLPYIC